MAPTKNSTVKAIVLTDSYAYHEVSSDPTSRRIEVEPPEGTSSTKGVEIEVTADEFKRGSELKPPALAKPKSDEAKAAQAEPVEQTLADRYALLSDDDLAAVVTARGGDSKGKSRDELLTFLTT